MSVTLAVDGLSFGYSRDLPVLHEWSQEFVGGEVVAVTGPSGRGKSTLLYLMGLMLKPTKGTVSINGVGTSGLTDEELAALRAHWYGFVFQDAALDATRTVLDNVLETCLYRGVDRNSAADAASLLLERLGVSVRADAKPGQVSGGQAQRIALCRAVLGNPLVVLADEPTGNLDADSGRTVMDTLHDQADRGAAVVIVTHDPSVVARCHREVRLT